MATRHHPRERTIENPVIGDRVTFVNTTAETQGAYLLEQIELAPHGGNALHYHLTFTERFEVLDGRLHIELDGQQLILGPGESAFVPLKAQHRFYSTSETPVTFRVELRPARQFEDALRIAYGLARDGRTTAQSVPKNIWELAVLFQMAETYLPGLPLRVQQRLFGTLATIARWLGVEQRLRDTYL